MDFLSVGPVIIRLLFAHPWVVRYVQYIQLIYQYISNSNQLSEVLPGSTHGNRPVSVSRAFFALCWR